MVELIKAILPLIVEIAFFFIGNAKKKQEEREALFEEAKQAIRDGDVRRINNIIGQLRVIRQEDNNTPNQ